MHDSGLLSEPPINHLVSVSKRQVLRVQIETTIFLPMAANTFKTPPPVAGDSLSTKPGSNVFAWLEGSIRLDSFVKEGIPARHLPKIAFSFFLCLLYIGISHHSNRTLQKLNKAKILLEDLRVNYTTQKADLMYNNKQSEVARMVAPMGLKESGVPPKKILPAE